MNIENVSFCLLPNSLLSGVLFAQESLGEGGVGVNVLVQFIFSSGAVDCMQAPSKLWRMHCIVQHTVLYLRSKQLGTF
jgi:hypothetical protein